MNLRARFAVVLCVALLSGAAAIADDVLILTNGDRISGRIDRIENGRIEVATSWAGAVRVDIDAVQTVEMDRDVTLVLGGRTRRAGRLAIDAGRMSLREDETAPPVPVDSKSVTAMHPGRVTRDEWRIGCQGQHGAEPDEPRCGGHRPS